MSSIITPRQQALKDAYSVACELLPVHLRRSAIIIGGTAKIMHGMNDRDSEDADIVFSKEVLSILHNVFPNDKHRTTDSDNSDDDCQR